MSEVKTILVIEDETDLITVLKELLEFQGYEVLTAIDGQIGLDTYLNSKDKISLVITDLNLPSLDGDKILKCISEANKNQRCILVSGYVGNEEMVTEYGDKVAFLQKPYKFQSLIELVKSMVE